MGGLIFIIVGIISLVIINYVSEKKVAKHAEQKAIAKKKHAIACAIVKAKEDEKWNEILAKRESQFGKLTKEIQIAFVNRERHIFIYHDAKIIILEGVEYSFKDIISVKIETRIKYGKETHITKPDTGELATQRFLYGMNKCYNVKEVTTITKTPDVTYYDVYIYLNSLEYPYLKYDIGTNAKQANNICALIEIVIRANSSTNEMDSH